MKQVLKILTLSALAFSLSGCASLLFGVGRDTPPRYTLHAAVFEQSDSSPINARLIIEDPQSEAAFDTAEIALSTDDLRFEYFTTGEWTDRAPRLLGIVLERSFQNSGIVTNIGDRTTMPIGDYIFYTDMRDFHMMQDNGGLIVKIAYYARLTKGNGETLAVHEFSTEHRVNSRTLQQAVFVFNGALEDLARETIIWVDDVISHDIADALIEEAEKAEAPAGNEMDRLD
jgi:ABC-type uncharacterized transport system auxiliary subunit